MEVKNLVTNAVPESTRNSTKYAVNGFEFEESFMYLCMGRLKRFNPTRTYPDSFYRVEN